VGEVRTDSGPRLFLGLDFGTSSLKAACLDEAGVVRAFVKKPLLTQLSKGIRAEQDPDMWWTALCECTKELLNRDSGIRERIAAIGICATTNTIVPCDSNLMPTAPAVMWLDRRADDEAKAIKLLRPRQDAEKVSSQHLVSRVLWFHRKSPELLAGFLIEEVSWLTHKLTGRLVVPRTIPEFTWGIPPEDWHELGYLAKELLPYASAVIMDAAEPTDAVGTLTPMAADETGLLPNTLVCSAGNDGLLAAVGAGLYVGESVIEIAGTGYTVWSRNPRGIKRPAGMPSAKNDPFSDETMISVSDLGEAGLFIAWLRELLGMNDQALETLCRKLAEEALSGTYVAADVHVEMTLFEYNSKGLIGASLSGLRPSTDAAELIKAVFEELAILAAGAARRHGADGLSGRPAILAGGISRNPLYRLIRSSVCVRQDIYLAAECDSGAIGAAMCAACAAGVYPNISSASAAMVPKGRKQDGSPVATLALSGKQR
jgi:sugar (pentulose or hexulose) kinase